MPTTNPGPWLEKLERLVDTRRVSEAERLQEQSWKGERVPRIPLLLSSLDDMSKERSHFTDWPLFRLEETLDDMGKMLLSELTPVYEGALLGDDKMYTLRANYGVGIVPSLFGCTVHQAGDEYPWVEPLDVEQIHLACRRGVPDLNRGLLPRVIETQAYFADALRPYPKLHRTVHLVMCDVQGPFNLASELLGSRIYTDLIDQPDRVRDVMELVTETFIAVARKEKKMLGEPLDGGYHSQYKIRGGVRICEDNALSISPRMYEEFCREYNTRAFAPFGGGYLLVCGGFRHVTEALLDTAGVHGLCYWTHDPMEFPRVYHATRRRGICLLWYGLVDRQVRKEVDSGLIVKARVRSLEEGHRILQERRR